MARLFLIYFRIDSGSAKGAHREAGRHLVRQNGAKVDAKTRPLSKSEKVASGSRLGVVFIHF